jgi:hypothetical protein
MGVAQKHVRSAESEADVASASQGKPLRAWAGHGGNGSRCDLCQQPIGADQVEYELELETASGLEIRRRVQSVKLHLDCYEQWMLLHEAMAENPLREDASEDPPAPDARSP